MKISINSTFSYIKFNLNYGSALQCFALQQYLKDRGHEPAHLRDYRANPKYILERFKNIKYPKLFFKKAKAQIKLQKFIKNNITLSENWYLSDKGLRKRCPDVACHIVGSDQIWHNANSFRYLTYVPDSKLKLSYAASFGSSTIPENMAQTIQPYLKRFDGITVREASGVKIIKDMGLEATHVLDPTLLIDLDRYPVKETEKKNYCFCYFLNLSKIDDVPFKYIKEYSSANSKKLIITAPLNYPLFLNEDLRFPEVEEWLGLYKNADCIFTNTYHGLLFCIIFKKQFLFCMQKGNLSRENERFNSLFEMLELTDRIIDETDGHMILKKMEHPIDYDNVYNIIKNKRVITDKFFETFNI